MPRGRMDKVDILSKIYKMKNELHNGRYNNNGKDWTDGADAMLNKVLDVINEYSQ